MVVRSPVVPQRSARLLYRWRKVKVLVLTSVLLLTPSSFCCSVCHPEVTVSGDWALNINIIIMMTIIMIIIIIIIIIMMMMIVVVVIIIIII